MYNFFKKSAVLEFYDGSALKRLIETRWSGHYDSVNQVYKNYGDLIQALQMVSKSKSKKLDSEDRALARGLFHQMEGDSNDDLFIFTNCMPMEELKPVNIIVKQLQSSSENIVSALSVIHAVRDYLKSTREVVDETKCESMAEKIRKFAVLRYRLCRPLPDSTTSLLLNPFLLKTLRGVRSLKFWRNPWICSRPSLSEGLHQKIPNCGKPSRLFRLVPPIFSTTKH